MQRNVPSKKSSEQDLVQSTGIRVTRTKRAGQRMHFMGSRVHVSTCANPPQGMWLAADDIVPLCACAGIGKSPKRVLDEHKSDRGTTTRSWSGSRNRKISNRPARSRSPTPRAPTPTPRPSGWRAPQRRRPSPRRWQGCRSERASRARAARRCRARRPGRRSRRRRPECR